MSQPPQLPFPRLPGARFSLFPTDLLFDHTIDRPNATAQKHLTIIPHFEPDVEEQLDEKAQLLVTPPDGGRKAWSFMAGAFLIESITWGFPSAFGTFVDYYSMQPEFLGETILASIGTTATGVATVMSPIGIYLGARYPQHRKTMMWLGLICCVGAAAGSAFVQTAVLLLLLQGAMWGFGTSMIVTPTLSFLVEWFHERKGLAYGIMFAGSGLSGGTFPFIFSALLQRFGHKVVLLGWAAFSLATLLPIITFTKGNFPLEQIPPVQKTQWKLLKAPLFSILGMTCFLQGFVVYLPGTLLSLYGIDVGLEKWQRDALLSVRNLSTIFGMPLFGWLADTLGAYIPLVIGSVLSSLAVFLLWGFARTFAMLLVFSFVFSVVTGGVVTLRARFATSLTSECEDHSQELLMFGIMRFLGGGGGIIGGFAASIFIPGPEESFTSEYAGGSWKMLIIFVGSIFLISSLGGFGRFFPVKKELGR